MITRVRTIDEVLGDRTDDKLWPNERIEAFLAETRGHLVCVMRDSVAADCTYPQLNLNGARMVFHGDKRYIACAHHAQMFCAVEDGAKFDTLSDIVTALQGEKDRREAAERERQYVEKQFRLYVQRHIAGRDGVDINLVTDAHIQARIDKLTPERISEIKRMMASQAEAKSVRGLRAVSSR